MPTMKVILGPLERMLTALEKDQSSFPAPTPGSSEPTPTLVLRDLIPSFGLCGLLDVGALIHMHIYKYT